MGSDIEFQLSNIFKHTSPTHEFEISWTRVGDSSKPPLILIHGTPWSSIVWHDLASALKSRYCVYLYDHPGFGQSPQIRRTDGQEPDLDASLSLRAEASAALVKHWRLSKPAHVVAHDNGGLVSLRLLLEHDIQYTSLCLVDVVAKGASGLPFFKSVAENLPVFQALPTNFIEGLVRSYIKSATHKPLHPQVENMLAEQWLKSGTQGPARFLQELVQAHNRSIGTLGQQYARVGERIPVKIVWGANDLWLPPTIASDLATALNAQEVVIVENAGHLMHYDQPSKLATEVALWVAQHNK